MNVVENMHIDEYDDDDEEMEVEDRKFWDDRRRMQRMAAVQVICSVIWLLKLRQLKFSRNKCLMEKREKELNRESGRTRLMNELKEKDNCRNITRMKYQAFVLFCNKLRNCGLLKDTRRSSIEEQVAKFLNILAHHLSNRSMSFYFFRSGETVSRHFHEVLRAVISLEDEYLQQPNGLEVPPKIQNNNRFFPYFKDCVGAIDGTHVRVKVSPADAPRFRGRKDYTTQNVFAACSFDLKFTYVLPGWEGTASDSRIIKNALTRDDNLIIPEGKYYLADGGYMLRGGLITPYRRTRYHLKEFASQSPVNSRELFNLRHSSLRNAIERAFGVLKKRFTIIASSDEKKYSYKVQCEIFLACCIIHNYLMDNDPDEDLITEVDKEIDQRPIPQRDEYQFRENDEEDSELGEKTIAEKQNEISEKRNEITERSKIRVYSEEEIFEELEKLAVPEHLIYKAYDFLTADQLRARRFFGCPVARRKDYLLDMISTIRNPFMD